MKSIGILTFHGADNYGAVLQACGLRQACKKLGYEASVIDYSPEYILRQYRYFSPTKNMRLNALRLFNLFGNLKKRRQFDKFRTEQLAIRAYDNSEFHALLYGSDQIWNPNISGDFDPVFFGINTLVSEKNIAYAASIGISALSDEQKDTLKVLLSHLGNISVREKSAIPVLEKLTEKNIQAVVDPTLLNDARYWDTVSDPVKNLPEQYIFVYEVSRHHETMERAKRISKQTGLPIVELVYEKNRLFSDHKQLNNIGPAEFITCIKNASYVVTSSFHGTAFSIIYRKDFYTVQHKTYGSRMYDLLDNLGLLDQIVTGQQDIAAVDYRQAEVKLNTMRAESMEFIRRALL